MSESTKEKLDRFVAELVERRQHACEICGHPGSKHAFDVVLSDNPNPCQMSCLICMNEAMKK
jgi:hypothetical protein